MKSASSRTVAKGPRAPRGAWEEEEEDEEEEEEEEEEAAESDEAAAVGLTLRWTTSDPRS